RRNLLEYDEVMDHQRKEVYKYRQRILDGANVRSLITGMVDEQIYKWASQFLSDSYRWETAAAFAAQHLSIQVDAADVRDMNKEQMTDYILDEASRQGEGHIYEKLEENLPQDVDQRDWNWQALAHWANSTFSLNLNDRELRKIAREGVQDEHSFNTDNLARYLVERATEMLGKVDLSPLDVILADDFGRRQLSGFLRQQFGVEISPDEFGQFEDPGDAIALAQRQVRAAYRDRETRFPVLVGLNRFATRNNQDRDGLINWANQRFETILSEDDLKNKEREQVVETLLDRARNFYPSPVEWDEFITRLDEAADPNSHVELSALASWAKSELEIDLNVAELEGLSPEEIKARAMQVFSQRYRPEFSQVERDVLLELLDNSWKSHLYYMDHLRSGIGLVGYAQKDPKVEFKRAGMAAFEEMWGQLGESVTSTMFRVESQSSAEYLDDLWANASAHHAQAMSAAQEAQLEMNSEGGNAEAPVVETIRNFEEKVGRNDPCPCGSGKKYKKCHGA
ncbi:MAG: SEC-C domain-containing protein, partial [Planctomycetaceae bacterium]|nr:SEC-C domain-containing protein [Planctomycetaceae bacterium]